MDKGPIWTDEELFKGLPFDDPLEGISFDLDLDNISFDFDDINLDLEWISDEKNGGKEQ